MSIIAGCKCPQCKDGMMIYTGRDRNRAKSSYQRIVKCNNCNWEATEDKVRTND